MTTKAEATALEAIEQAYWDGLQPDQAPGPTRPAQSDDNSETLPPHGPHLRGL